MQPTGRIEPSGSPAPGIIPDPAYVHDEPTAPDQPRPAAATAGSEKSPAHRGRASGGLARVLRVIRGDKHMTNAYPPARHHDGIDGPADPDTTHAPPTRGR
jgi:hypothetical protein